MAHNPNCDGNHCRYSTSEVRVLSTGGSSNAILCRACFEYELAWRKDRNKKLAKEVCFKLPLWESLPVYGE